MTFRADVEGLRAVAIAIVVLAHARLGFAAGGYVGVDVFFVISGFLITGLLRGGARRARGRVSVARFYARRVQAPDAAGADRDRGGRWSRPGCCSRRSRRTAVADDVVAAGAYAMNWHLSAAGGRLLPLRRGRRAARPLVVARGRGAVLRGLAVAAARARVGLAARAAARGRGDRGGVVRVRGGVRARGAGGGRTTPRSGGRGSSGSARCWRCCRARARRGPRGHRRPPNGPLADRNDRCLARPGGYRRFRHLFWRRDAVPRPGGAGADARRRRRDRGRCAAAAADVPADAVARARVLCVVRVALAGAGVRRRGRRRARRALVALLSLVPAWLTYRWIETPLRHSTLHVRRPWTTLAAGLAGPGGGGRHRARAVGRPLLAARAGGRRGGRGAGARARSGPALRPPRCGRARATRRPTAAARSPTAVCSTWASSRSPACVYGDRRSRRRRSSCSATRTRCSGSRRSRRSRGAATGGWSS